MSPRTSCRVGIVDAYGTIPNLYPVQQSLRSPCPDVPWAVNLTDSQGRWWLICFDLDAGPNPYQAQRDAKTLQTLLRRHQIAHVTCQSGPSGGRHIWIALSQPSDTTDVARLAGAAKRAAPSLDIKPLSNPATGCVRPPGAPHRSGGRSTVIEGSLDALTTATTTPTDLTTLVTELEHRYPPESLHDGHHDAARTIAVDANKDPWLPGVKRPLPPASKHALDHGADPHREDASASSALWRFLIGAANAHWTLSDVTAHWDAPGLEHVRTIQEAHTRRQRPSTGPYRPQMILAQQWRKAVTWAAQNGVKQGTDDPDFHRRCTQLADLIDHHQSVADSTPGRWTNGGGATQRRVLDAIHAVALQAVSPTVSVPLRRLALMAGIGRSTADRAITQLHVDGTITKLSAQGQDTLIEIPATPSSIHSHELPSGTQAVLRPLDSPTRRSQLLHRLTSRLERAAHDLYGPTGIPHRIGNLAARLEEMTVEETTTIEYSLRHIRTQHPGLIRKRHGRWNLCSRQRRDRTACAMGLKDRLKRREHSYRIERAAWEWWKAELAWMKASKTEKAGRGQMMLLGHSEHSQWPPHPRTPDHKADYKAARQHLRSITKWHENTSRLHEVAPHRTKQGTKATTDQIIEELHALDPPLEEAIEELANARQQSPTKQQAMELLTSRLGAHPA